MPKIKEKKCENFAKKIRKRFYNLYFYNKTINKELSDDLIKLLKLSAQS